MTAADRTREASPPRLAALLTQLFRRPFRARGSVSRNVRNVPVRPAPKIDLGDLAVAQFVHDLRNQLTVMIACADRIFQLVPRGEADYEIAELRVCAERASQLTRELLIAARPGSAPRGPVELNLVVNGVMPTLSRFLGERIQLRTRLSQEPVTVLSEPLELERILLNLALNARDAMADGGDLTIETDVADLLPLGQVTGEPVPYAQLSVTDTGCGMTPDVEARIFEPFFTTRATGTGLGLSSIAFTVRQLQGMVSVQSEPGQGTRVTVHLPCSR
jgi:signal transduction histidine kinase